MNRLLAITVMVCLLGGCTPKSVESTTVPTPSSVASVPADGVSLQELGFANGPQGFSVPREARITQRVDQPNVVTMVVSDPSATRFVGYLRQHLAGMGFRITADSPDALVFTNGRYDGAFARGNGVSGLTLRRV